MGDVTDRLNLAARPRVVIDTCVLLRAMYHRVFPEIERQENVLSFNALALARRSHAICFTEATRSEALHMIARMRRRPCDGPSRDEERIRFVQKFIEQASLLVQPAASSLQCRDPKDQMFLEAAAGAKADYVISTDKDLLVLGHDGFCQIVLPEKFSGNVSEEIAQKKRSARKAARAQAKCG